MRLLLLALAPLLACRAHTAPPQEGARDVTVRVPGALRVARELDALSVGIDPAASADTTVHVDPAMFLGVESATSVFATSDPTRALGERHGYTSGAAFDVGTSTWNLRTDGFPQPDKRYVAEMTLTLFETDVPPGHAWDPHAGRFEALLTRTLRQAEE